MWPRIAELTIAAWLAASAFVFGLPESADTSVVPLAAAGLVVVAFAASRRWRLAHLLTLVVALALIGWGWARFPRPGPAAAQNAILCGLILGLLAIVPNQAMKPPLPWRPHVRGSD
ncbi:MAG: hypothetical protein R3304_08910 [Longimicrobiales bacterium]|nr:hypothetical protein [Longimicrobiales bacterium]